MTDIEDREDVIEELNDLIQLDHDAVLTYQQALEHVDADDVEVRSDLEAFMADHQRHIADLSRVVIAFDGTPKEPGRDVKGVLLEGMTKLRSVTGTLGALKAMRMNEKLTNHSYEKVSQRALPADVLSVVTMNLADERRHLAAIETHIERMAEFGDTDDVDREDLDRDEDVIGAGSVLDEHPNVRM
ncbi:MAG TPA: DUF2383 domain-containing protein [Kofleriaceae bacterium]|nr:DUF2383 domain-containing protein [Kofleriaceae bacterium]